jgi:hypothetical protein
MVAICPDCDGAGMAHSETANDVGEVFTKKRRAPMTRIGQLDELLQKIGARWLCASRSVTGTQSTFYLLPNGKHFIVLRYGKPEGQGVEGERYAEHDGYDVFLPIPAAARTEKDNDLTALLRLALEPREDKTTPEEMSLDAPPGTVLRTYFKDRSDQELVKSREWYTTLRDAPRPEGATIDDFVRAAFELARVAMLTAMEYHLASGGEGVGTIMVQGDYSKYEAASWENRYVRDQPRQ